MQCRDMALQEKKSDLGEKSLQCVRFYSGEDASLFLN